MLQIDSDLQAVLMYFVPPFLLVLAPPVLAFTLLRSSKKLEQSQAAKRDSGEELEQKDSK